MTATGKATTQQQYKDLIKYHNQTALKAIQIIEKNHVSTGKLRESLLKKKVYTIADYGCSTGTMSIDILKYLIKQVRKCEQEPVHIQLVMNDLPQNDFDLLHQNLKSGLDELFDKHVEIIDKPVSFYQKVAQDNEVDFGVSIYTTHWLSKSPSSHLQNSFWAIEQDSQEIFKKWVDQADDDIKLFFQLRAKEMNEKAYVLVINIGNEYKEMKAGSSYQTLPGTGFIKKQLRSEGFNIQYVNSIFNTLHYRSDDQIKKALRQIFSKQQKEEEKGSNDKYRVTGFFIPQGMYNNFVCKLKNFAKYAQYRTQFIKSTSQALFRSQLQGQNAKPEQTEKILNRIWQLQTQYLQSIEKHSQNPENYYLQAIQLFN